MNFKVFVHETTGIGRKYGDPIKIENKLFEFCIDFIFIFVSATWMKMDLSQVYIYRMTHIENIPHILEHGITHKDSPDANPDYISIGDVSLIDTRASRRVNVSNGKRSEIYGSIVLGDFIPFYFGVRMPMLYVMQLGGNYVERATPPQDIVYVACKLSDVVSSNILFYFSDGHATDNFSMFYDNSKITDLSDIIDWQSIKSSYWGGEENLDVRRKKQAEFLVANDIPVNFMAGFVCYNESAKKRLVEMGVEEGKIKIYTQAYF